MKNLKRLFVITLHIQMSLLLITAQAQESPACFEHGECMDSLLLDYWHDFPDAQRCLEQCQQDNNCEFFTFYEEDNSCLTFANCVTFSANSCNNCYSGERSCEDLNCGVVGICSGVLVGETFDVDQDECLAECQSNVDCQWFTHDSDGNICLMFEDCQDLDDSCDTCISGQRQCSEIATDTGYTKIIVIGGYNYDLRTYLDSIEVIDLENPSSNCSLIPNYPIEAAGMAVGIVDGLIKSCGSYYENKQCFDYDPATNSWTTSSNLIYLRSNPRSSIIQDIWLISGESEDSDSTEMWTGNEFELGPPLQYRMEYGLCQLTINSTHVYFADPLYHKPSQLLDWETMLWTKLPAPTINGHLSPNCGLINNPENGLEVVILENGKTEIFNFNSLTWRSGPDVHDFMNAGQAQLGDTFVLVGGDEDNDTIDKIFIFDQINYELIQLDQRLRVARDEYPGVVAVPDNFVSCT